MKKLHLKLEKLRLKKVKIFFWFTGYFGDIDPPDRFISKNRFWFDNITEYSYA